MSSKISSELLKAANDAAATLLATDDEISFEDSIVSGLEAIGRSIDVDRIHIWQNETIDGKRCYTKRYEWLTEYGKKDAPPPPGVVLEYNDNVLGWERMFLNNEHMNCPITELSPSERQYLGSYGLKSIVNVPLFLKNRLWGFFSTDDCRQERVLTDEQISFLRSAGLMMMHAIERNQQDSRLREAQTRIEHRDTLLRMSSDAAVTLLSTASGEQFDVTFTKSMKQIAEYMDVDRIGIWQITMIDGTPHYKCMHNYSTELGQQGEGLSDNMSFPFTIFSDEWNNTLASGQCIKGVLADLTHQDRNVFSKLGARSILDIPMFIQGVFWGIATFNDYHNDRSFSEDEISILRSVGLMMVSAFMRHEMTQSLIYANEAKSAFLSSMSHEIRTPMNAVLGIAEMQLQNEALPDATKEAFNMIVNSGELLLNIINDLLDLSKIEAGKAELLPDKYEVASLINDTMMLNMTRLGSKQIEFTLSVDENIPTTLIGDELRIKQILNNLLSNAFKYTQEGMVNYSVSMETTEHADNADNADNADTIENTDMPDNADKPDSVTLILKVTDTGIGMTVEQLGKLFDKYERFDSNINRSIQGTGLGMPITKSLVDMMGGSITVKSVVGEGSEFEVRLPQTKASETVLGKELAENLRLFRKNGMKQLRKSQIVIEPMPYGNVLVVDDVESNIYVAKGLMQPYSLNVDSVTSGFAAIDRIKNGKVYDVVFMDHMMPKMDGIEAVKIIRDMGYTHPIVALTANAIVGQSDIFLQNGFDGFVSKPIDTRELNAVLIKFVRSKHPAQFAQFEIPARPPIDPGFAEIVAHDIKKALEVLDGLGKKPDALTDEDIQSYIITVHSLKSILANLREPELSATAYKLEQAGRKKDIAVITVETPLFLPGLRAIYDNLVSTDNPLVKATEDDLSQLGDKLLIIKECCIEYDVDSAIDMIDELRQRDWCETTNQLLSSIADFLLHSDFEDAASLIDSHLNP